jgi:hypothetical protein
MIKPSREAGWRQQEWDISREGWAHDAGFYTLVAISSSSCK